MEYVTKMTGAIQTSLIDSFPFLSLPETPQDLREPQVRQEEEEGRREGRLRDGAAARGAITSHNTIHHTCVNYIATTHTRKKELKAVNGERNA